MQFDVFVIDPPWQQVKGGLRKARPKQKKHLDYATMGTREIFELLDRDVFNRATNHHCVFIWTIESS